MMQPVSYNQQNTYTLNITTMTYPVVATILISVVVVIAFIGVSAFIVYKHIMDHIHDIRQQLTKVQAILTAVKLRLLKSNDVADQLETRMDQMESDSKLMDESMMHIIMTHSAKTDERFEETHSAYTQLRLAFMKHKQNHRL
jgi:hypothetical protein